MIETSLIIVMLITSYFILTINFGRILTKEIKMSKLNVILIISLALLNYFASYDNELVIKTFATFFTFMLISLLIYGENEKRATITTIIYFIITLFSELFIMLIFSIFIKNGKDYVVGPSILKASTTLINMILVFYILSIKKVSLKIQKIYEMLENQYKYIKYTVYIIISILLIFFVYVVKFMDGNSLILSFIFFITCVLIILSSIVNVYKNNNLILMNNLLSINESIYESSLENYKLFKHNLMHEFNCIKSIGDKKVNKLIDEYILKYSKNNIPEKLLMNTPKGIKGVIYQKVIEYGYDKCNVVVDNKIKKDPFKYLNNRKYCSLCECLGIVLDNSIEATTAIGEPVYILLHEDKINLYIDVTNKCSGILDVDKLGINKKSTKSNHYGIGLKYIVNNNHVKTKIKIHNNNFNVQLKIKK